MKSVQIAKVAAVLFVSGIVLTPASSAPAGLLRPLTGADMEKTKETGCNFAFEVNKKQLVQAVGHDFTIRTATGLKVCRITDAAFQKMGDGSNTTCGGYSLKFRRLAPSKQYPQSDSAGWPASLTIGQGTRTLQTLRGDAGVAC